MPEPIDQGLLDTLVRVAAVLKQADVPFALMGGFAVYAHGGTSSDHDVDFALREQDIPRVLDALEAAGFRHEEPPEDWLTKVFDGENMVDLIYGPSSGRSPPTRSPTWWTGRWPPCTCRCCPRRS